MFKMFSLLMGLNISQHTPPKKHNADISGGRNGPRVETGCTSCAYGRETVKSWEIISLTFSFWWNHLTRSPVWHSLYMLTTHHAVMSTATTFVRHSARFLLSPFIALIKYRIIYQGNGAVGPPRGESAARVAAYFQKVLYMLCKHSKSERRYIC